MPHWIATSWDKNQLLILAARTKKGKAFYEKAVRILPDLPSGKSDAQADVVPGFTPETVKAKLRHFVQQERLGKCDTVVVVGRDDVEVRSMLFPPVPNDELPDMAKFQAAKEFTEYDQNASLDFVLFDGARKDKKHILAAALTKSKRETVEDVVTGAGLDLQRIVLGPCESAKRFATITVQQKTGGAGKTTLLVEIGELSATLVLLYRGQPAFVRTAHFQKPVWAELDQADKKLFENADELAKWKWLTSEFKRTIVAAINDVPSEKIDEIVLCGVGERYEKLVLLLQESMAVPVSLFNVWRFENREGEIKNHLPVFEEQFLPLVGALTAMMAEKPNAIDFRNPKRKAEKRTNRNLITGIVAVCMLLLITTGGWGYFRRVSIESELASLQTEETNLIKATERHDQLKLQYEKINGWKDSDVNWLKELEWLSNSLLDSQTVMLTGNLSMTAPDRADPNFRFTALTRGTAVIPQLESGLRDATHNVISPKVTPVPNNQTYTHSSDITVKIIPPPKPQRPGAVTDTVTPPDEEEIDTEEVEEVASGTEDEGTTENNTPPPRNNPPPPSDNNGPPQRNRGNAPPDGASDEGRGTRGEGAVPNTNPPPTGNNPQPPRDRGNAPPTNPPPNNVPPDGTRVPNGQGRPAPPVTPQVTDAPVPPNNAMPARPVAQSPQPPVVSPAVNTSEVPVELEAVEEFDETLAEIERLEAEIAELDELDRLEAELAELDELYEDYDDDLNGGTP